MSTTTPSREAVARTDAEPEYTAEEIAEIMAEAQDFRQPAPPPIPVRGLFYLTSCRHCGWVGSSEQCGSDAGGDDSDVYCPVCCRRGCESAPDDGERAEHGAAVMARIDAAEAEAARLAETVAVLTAERDAARADRRGLTKARLRRTGADHAR